MDVGFQRCLWNIFISSIFVCLNWPEVPNKFPPFQVAALHHVDLGLRCWLGFPLFFAQTKLACVIILQRNLVIVQMYLHEAHHIFKGYAIRELPHDLAELPL